MPEPLRRVSPAQGRRNRRRLAKADPVVGEGLGNELRNCPGCGLAGEDFLGCLNWKRYTGAPDEFEAAASELLAFIRLDVRNRILRRYPLAFPARAVRSLFGLSNRKLTRPGLLEYHYEKYLYGDTSLFQLPESPCLHLLATNISEGRLCSFNRNGLWVIRRGENHTTRIEQIPIGLATVPMAVAASSAFLLGLRFLSKRHIFAP